MCYSVSHAYWVFAAMATQVYLIMYVLMFIAAMRLRRSQPDHERGYRAPALGLLCLLGAVSSAAAFVIGFVPALCQNLAQGLKCCFMLGARAHSPHLPVHGPGVRLAGALGAP